LPVRLLIQPASGEPIRKITKVIPYPTGGFAVVAPYHPAQRGWLARVPADYTKHEYKFHRSQAAEYDANDRVKLSDHADGFVQFSGERPGRIESGRDPETGEAKGLGLISNPISEPIRTGPTFSVQSWGIHEFQEAAKPGSEDIVFDEEDFYFRRCTPDDANSFLLECFVLPNRLWAGVRRRGHRHTLFMSHHHFEGTGLVLEWCVVPLPGQPAFLAFCVSRMRVGFTSPSGFILNGPGYRLPDGTGEVLIAMYPPPPMINPPSATLDRKA